MELVAFVGADKENWGQITALINRSEAERVILVENEKVEGFPVTERCEVVGVDSRLPLLMLKEQLLDKLRKLLSGDFEVAVTLASGTGKEHMALISALLSIPVGIRLVVYTKDGVQVIN
ncbi:MAG TPA: hypothetical protein VJK03_03775 [Candidatus Nanoarchaeia archaeon]|nr:hypothetical protein [Candidatus Nanoarchaeia archaeon]